MSGPSTTKPARPKQSSPLMYFLVFMSCVFIGILIFAYMVTKRTHPIYVDEHGKPVNAETSDHHSDAGNGTK